MSANAAKILLVEDNKLGREMISSFLEELGFSCVATANGIEALDMLPGNNFDLILMDIEMPLLNGYQTTEIIRSKGLKMPIIALTAHDSDEIRKKCIVCGMTSSIAKPFQKEELHSLLIEQLQCDTEKKFGVENNISNAGEVINLAFLTKISRGRKDFFMSMIDIFIEQNKTDLQTLSIAVETSDFDTIRLLAHKIRTSISFIGLEKRILDQLQEMEMLGEKGNNIERIIHLYSEIFSVCVKAEEELELVKEQGELK